MISKDVRCIVAAAWQNENGLRSYDIVNLQKACG